jgi:hypothetical protein
MIDASRMFTARSGAMAMPSGCKYSSRTRSYTRSEQIRQRRNIYGTKQQGKALLISLAERKIVPRFSQNANENLF